MKKKFFWLTAILLAVFLSGCDQKIYTSKKIENPGQETPKPNNPQPNPNHTPSTKYKVTITQPANGKIEVTPALPTDGTVDKGRELTFTLSANSGYKVKALTINGTTYSDVTDNSITKKIKIEKNTAVSGTVEAETGLPAEEITIGNSNISITKDKNNNIVKATGNITLDEIEELAKKSTNDVVINTDALTIKSFKTENNENKILTISKDKLEKIATKLSILKIENLDETKQNITLDKNADIKTISGNISLIDIMESNNTSPETEITKYIANNLKNNSNKDFDSSKLTINTFYKKKKTSGSISSRNVMETNSNSEYISTPITPTFLKETNLNALNKAILNFKDKQNNIHTTFASREIGEDDYFDINQFYNEIENGKLKNISVNNIKGYIFLRGKKETINGKDNYPEISKLVKISKKLEKKFTVGSVELSGNVGEILQKLINEEILEDVKRKSIRFIYDQKLCTTDFYTGYFGKKSGSNLSIEQLKEYYNRSNIMQLDDVTITGLNSENYKGSFIRNMLTNVNFINCDLSKISFHKSQTGGGYLKFENTTLPENMEGAAINHLILKNSKLPQNLIALPSFASATNTSLRIYNRDKDFFSLLKSEIYEIEAGHPPEKYIGPEDIWKDIKYKEGKIRKGLKNGYPKLKNNKKPIKFHFTEDDKTDTDLDALEYTIENTTGSLNKSLTQLLALIQNQGRTRG